MSAYSVTGEQEQVALHRLYNLYNSYRFLLGVVFTAIATIPQAPLIFDAVSTGQALAFSIIYTLNALVVLLTIRHVPSTTSIFAITFLDIILLCALLLMGDNTQLRLGNLLFVPIAIGNILIPGRIGVLLAAMASIFLLLIEYATGETGISQQLHAGLSGILFFITTFLIQSYNHRLKSTVDTARISQTRAINLQQLSLSIMQHMRTGILVLREPNKVVMMNEAAIQMLDSPQTEGNLNSISPQLLSAYWQWRENPMLRIDSFSTNADTPEVQPGFTRLAYEADVYVLIFLDDKATMAQQAQQLKLAALGQLTASIAHEIRNPLGAISHSAQLISESENLDKHDTKLLNIIHKHCRRMNNIIETILQLSRKETWQPELLDINDWVNHFVRDEHFSGFENPEIHYNPQPRELMVRFDAKQLHQVLMNLCLNGLRYSMQNTGTAWLELRSGVNPSGHPWLEIIDRGPGIPKDERNNIFAPFFTTDKNGTGLGLYISRELCEANHASLELLPEETGTGCIFRISFAHPGKRIE